MKSLLKAFLYGVFAVIIVLLINSLVLSFFGFPEMVFGIIRIYWPLLILLIGGFGLQVGLFVYYRRLNAISCSTATVSGGISGVSMILCCSHYLLNILPFLGTLVGISFLAALSDYTIYFLLIGIASNIFGIGIIFYQKNKFSRRRNEK